MRHLLTVWVIALAMGGCAMRESASMVPCDSESTCGGDGCIGLRGGTGGLCSARCTDDTDCGFGWRCTTFDGDASTGQCLPTCGLDGDCAEAGRGWRCGTTAMFGASASSLMACLPAAE